MDDNRFKIARRFYRSIIFLGIWGVSILILIIFKILPYNVIFKGLLKYYILCFPVMLVIVLIYFMLVKKIGINELIDYITETTNPLPFFSKRTYQENQKLGRIFFYSLLSILAIINYFVNLVSWDSVLYILGLMIIFDLAAYFLGFYNFLEEKIDR